MSESQLSIDSEYASTSFLVSDFSKSNMALVSYGINNSSEDEDDQNETTSQNTLKPMIHSAIPRPKSWCSVPNDISLLERNRAYPVRILASPLRQHVGERPKKIVRSTIGSALVSILPEPKHSKKDFMFQEPVRKKDNNHRSNNVNLSVDSAVDSNQIRKSDESDNHLSSFFFPSSIKDDEGDIFAGDLDNEEISVNHIFPYNVRQGVTSEDTDQTSDGTELCTTFNRCEGKPQTSSSLTADDLVKLCGSHGKHLPSNSINLIEIDGSKLANPAEMKMNHLKSLTYDYNSLYRQHKFKSSRRERSKHQITYLVEHAKFFEREVISHPKNSKISQKRYGF